MAVIRIEGTSSYTSTITGKTYSSKARAEAAERASERMKKLWEEKKIPLVDPSAPAYVTWEDIPYSEKSNTTDSSYWHGSDHRKHAQWFYEHGYTEWATELFVANYEANIDETEIIDAVLEKSPRFKDFEMHYFELAKEWKLIKKDSTSELPDVSGDVEVKGTERGIKAGL